VEELNVLLFHDPHSIPFAMDFPMHFLQNSPTNIHKLSQPPTNDATLTTPKTWVTFIYYNPMIHKLTNLLQNTNPKFHSIPTITPITFYTPDCTALIHTHLAAFTN
jgi:hypothetical protein